ncbi:MAG TPA: pyridoxal-phosphate dependent enzyme [Thermomicrobiales bacterium]|nr:pyridoxal-phosphate dependent enzyme [Thermomicrobiales bacterium]
MIEYADIVTAAERLAGVAHHTPAVTSRSVDARTGASVFLKAENLQRVGAFKFRGAYNKISRLSDDELRRGVVTVSSGNHAQAVALAATLMGTTAKILMPEDAPAIKVAGVKGFGGEVVPFDRYAEDRDALLLKLADRESRVIVHPYDDPLVMAGQGTCTKELIEDVGDLTHLFVCVGGGGLIAGCATAAKALLPGCQVIGVEPEAGDDTRQSLARGERVSIPVPETIADGQQTTAPGKLTFPIIQQRVDQVVTVSDAEIVAAMRFAFERLKLVLEPSGACAFAAVLTGKLDIRGGRVGVTLSGGNVDLGRFCALAAS